MQPFKAPRYQCAHACLLPPKHSHTYCHRGNRGCDWAPSPSAKVWLTLPTPQQPNPLCHCNAPDCKCGEGRSGRSGCVCFCSRCSRVFAFGNVQSRIWDQAVHVCVHYSCTCRTRKGGTFFAWGMSRYSCIPVMVKIPNAKALAWKLFGRDCKAPCGEVLWIERAVYTKFFLCSFCNFTLLSNVVGKNSNLHQICFPICTIFAQSGSSRFSTFAAELTTIKVPKDAIHIYWSRGEGNLGRIARIAMYDASKGVYG